MKTIPANMLVPIMATARPMTIAVFVAVELKSLQQLLRLAFAK
jgi:hypothetical protein